VTNAHAYNGSMKNNNSNAKIISSVVKQTKNSKETPKPIQEHC